MKHYWQDRHQAIANDHTKENVVHLTCGDENDGCRSSASKIFVYVAAHQVKWIQESEMTWKWKLDRKKHKRKERP